MSATRPQVREARQTAGLTQQAVADCLGVPRPVVTRWETGVREPGVRAAVRLARVLGTTADELWAPDNESGAAPRQRPTP